MTANTVYDVFLALSPEEKEKFIVLLKGQKVKPNYEFTKKKQKKSNFKRSYWAEVFCLQLFSNPNTNIVILVMVLKTTRITIITNSYD